VKRVISAAVAGILFGVGLAVSGMTRADKVIGFLDLSDAWDPSLAFVMGGAIAVHLVLFKLILRRTSPLFAQRFALPTRTDLDTRLIVGSGLFGVGWALGGYCPGPGLVSSGGGGVSALVFLATLTLGIGGVQAAEHYRTLQPQR
jgi:uncharacterized membrane protein YedE/YeeE